VNKKPVRQPLQAEQAEPENNEAAADDDGWEVAGRGKRKAHHMPVQPTPTTQQVTEELKELKVEDNNIEQAVAAEASNEADKSENVESEDIYVEDEDDESDHDDDSDGGEWITPENVIEVKAAELGQKVDKRNKKHAVMQAACITADFAMQVKAPTHYHDHIFIRAGHQPNPLCLERIASNEPQSCVDRWNES
jgi:hypothetical protein